MAFIISVAQDPKKDLNLNSVWHFLPLLFDPDLSTEAHYNF